ncbi:Gfo/Idh/MocA family protein [Streptomyces roseolus]|uniref:Gfo/Idh/MocA family protein n=1 Tax=Streptomyces roseolus TaxID=67358 RepID=UPI003702B04C
MFSLGIVGAGQFAGSFATLWRLHPNVGDIEVTDLLPERAERLVVEHDLAGTLPSFEAMLDSDLDAIALFTQRWTHGPLAVRALRAGKDVYSAVPMGVTEAEIADIIAAVEETGRIYMMGETSHYHPATVYARARIAAGDFGRIFYAEGDYVHDMDWGFYDAYKYSGGADWKSTASYPPLLYPTHSIGGVLGAWRTHAVSVSAIGVPDERGDGVFDREISRFDNDFSNATALFEVAGGGSFRTNEFRRVGYIGKESRFRYFGTEAVLEQLGSISLWQDKKGERDVSAHLHPAPTLAPDDPALSHVAPELRGAFASGTAPVHDRSRLPREFAHAPNGHEGSHHFLADDFATAVTTRTPPPLHAWTAARYTLPGIIAHQSALRAGVRLPIPDHGDGPRATS